MQIIPSISLYLLTLLPAAAQTELLPGRLPINEAIRWELAIGSIPADTTLYSQPPDYYAQPIIFKRTAGKFKPDATVRYHFSRIDSLPFRIEYYWDANSRTDRREWIAPELLLIEPMSRLAEYDAEYDSLRSELVSRYGEPLYGSSEPASRYRSEHGHYVWSRDDHWDQDGMTIEMYMHFADSSAPGGYEIWIDQKWD